MGVALSTLTPTQPSAGEYRSRLATAGYVLNEELELWMHGGLDRALDARIAARLTLDQIDEWIAAGR
jgi:hypothetical protein